VRWIKNILREVFSLFVDDGKFALAILVWLGIVRLVLPHVGITQSARGIVLFAGLGIILIESTTRYSRGKQPPGGK
jgi:hypothetical protein